MATAASASAPATIATATAAAGGAGGEDSQVVPQTQQYAGGEEDEAVSGNWGRLVPLVKDCREIELLNSKAEYTLGRGRACDVRLSDIHISTNHCRLFRVDAKTAGMPPAVFLVDSSANGTFVNKQRLDRGKQRQLYPGDTVSLVTPSQSHKDAMAAFIFQQLPPSAHEVKARADATTTRDILDSYDIKEELGSGSYAVVRRAVNKTTGESVAVKIIDKKRFKLLPSFDMNSLLREAEVLRELHHPYIISLRDIFQTEDTLYIVTEFVTGGELFDRIVNGGAYSEPRAKMLMKRLFEAIKHLHDRNIVHRDLKPENLLLRSASDDTEVKVADFGVAKTLGFEGLKTFCGSPQYFAPEVLRRKNTILGQGRYGKGADMCLSGAPPFDEQTFEAKKENVRYNFSLPVWRHVSDDAKDLIHKLLNPDPIERYTIDEALAHSWLRGVKTESPTVTASGATTARRKRGRGAEAAGGGGVHHSNGGGGAGGGAGAGATGATGRSSSEVADDELEDPLAGPKKRNRRAH